MLHQRQKWILPKRNSATDEVVLLIDQNSPRCLWSLSRVVETYLGKDGFVRTVQVKTAISILVRLIDKLSLLESLDG